MSVPQPVGKHALPITPDFGSWSVRHHIREANVDGGHVRVLWDDGRESRFHFRWLRDTCPCSECLNPDSREQILDVSTLDPHIAAREATVDAAGALAVIWDGDGHRSRFHPGWLRAHDYSNPASERNHTALIETWDAGFAARIPTFDGGAVMADDAVLLDWLTALCRYGLTRLHDVPIDDDALLRAAARIGVVRESVFGRTFDVRAESNPISNAYTSMGLLPHTDLPTREVQPGIQMLHCLTNEASGGESVMVDGLRLAEVMRREHPQAFDVLTRVPIEFSSRGRDSEYRWRAPMIALNDEGQVTELRPGALLRAPVHAPFDEMEAVYDGIQTFFRLTNDDALRAVFPIRPGDLLAFDNRRVLHARTAYDTRHGERHLRGCYIDQDELLSRIRVLMRGMR